MSILKNLLTLTIGAAIGSFVTWKLVKEKYAQIAQEEIDSVKEVFSNRQGRSVTKPTDKNKTETDGNEGIVNTDDVKNIIQNYKTYSKKEETEKKFMSSKPYVITPEQYNDGDYTAASVTYYADGVLVDGFDEIIEDVDNVVGLDSLTHFGEHEADSVFVRNDNLEIDYEILRDLRDYWDVFPDGAD